MKRIATILRELFDLYNRIQIPRAAAALSYYLTMTFFPLVICLNSLLGYNFKQSMRILSFIGQFISSNASAMLQSFLLHIAVNNNSGIFAAGLLALVTSASAGIRTLQATIGEMQGQRRYQGMWGFLFSVVFSLLFMGAIYFAVLVVFTSRDILDLINGYLPFFDISRSWSWIRFLILGVISFLLLWVVYAFSKARGLRYKTAPGALFSTVGLVFMTSVFSNFIGVSARYPLIYGSLASVTLLMFWLFLVCQIIFLGAALNLVISRHLSGEDGQG